MAVSPVQYVLSDGSYIAYQTAGTGPPNIVLVNDWFSHASTLWARDSPFRPVLDALSGFARLITFDKRGVGLSDPVPLNTVPSLEGWIDDVRAVLDRLDIERTTIIGKGSGGPMALLFTATHPDRVDKLILVNSWARAVVDDDFPIGFSPRFADANGAEPYMSAEAVRVLAGEPISPRVEQWWQTYVRNAASPTTSLTMRQWLWTLDVRPVLASIHVPTLVMCRREAWMGAHQSRYLADAIDGAELIELDGSADFLFTGDLPALLGPIQRFVTGRDAAPAATRVLAAVLFTDLVDSTGLATSMGDERWGQLLARHDEVVKAAVADFGGHMIRTVGDGAVARFDGPSRSIRCAQRIRDDLEAFGLDVRAGLHAGEVEVRGRETGGIALHIAARVEPVAEAGEILVTRTLRDLVAGSDIEFEHRGTHELKGLTDAWDLYCVVG